MKDKIEKARIINLSEPLIDKSRAEKIVKNTLSRTRAQIIEGRCSNCQKATEFSNFCIRCGSPFLSLESVKRLRKILDEEKIMLSKDLND